MCMKDYSEIVGFVLMCYHKENQTAKEICKSTELVILTHHLIIYFLLWRERKRTEIHSPKSRKAEKSDRQKQSYRNFEG